MNKKILAALAASALLGGGAFATFKATDSTSLVRSTVDESNGVDDSDLPTDDEAAAEQLSYATMDFVSIPTISRSGSTVTVNVAAINGTDSTPTSVTFTVAISTGTFVLPLAAGCTQTSALSLSCVYVSLSGNPTVDPKKPSDPFAVVVASADPVTAMVSVTHDVNGLSADPNPANNTKSVTST